MQERSLSSAGGRRQPEVSEIIERGRKELSVVVAERSHVRGNG